MGGTSSSGGHLSSVYYTKLSSDGTVGSWTTSTNSLPSTLYYPSAAVYNGYLYVMGGYSSGFHNAVYYAKINADGSIGSWSTSTNALPQGMYLGAGGAANGYLYFLGGVNSSFTQLDTVYYAAINSDGSVGTWGVETNHMPRGVEDARSFIANGYIYEMGGINGAGAINSVYYAKLNSDGATGVWATNSNALPQALDGPTATSANGYVYVTGGNDSGNASQNAVYYAALNSDGSTGAWTTSANTLPQTLQFSASVINDGYLYVFEGQNNGMTQRTAYYANLNFVSQKAITSSGSSEPVAIGTPAGTNITNAATAAATSTDSGFSYPLGLLNFTFTTNTLVNQISLNFQTTLTPSQVVARKYNATTKTYTDIPGATITETTLNGQPALNVSYSITDGGPLDEDGVVNGVIVDPVGLAQIAASSTTNTTTAPNTGYGTPQQSDRPAIFMAITGAAMVGAAGFFRARSARRKQ